MRDISTPLDELGLVICARMYHRHIGIILQNDVWCSRMDNDFDKCFIKLAFMGGILFCDTAFDNEYPGGKTKTNTLEVLKKFPSLDISPVVKPAVVSGHVGHGRGRKTPKNSKSVSPVAKEKTAAIQIQIFEQTTLGNEFTVIRHSDSQIWIERQTKKC